MADFGADQRARIDAAFEAIRGAVRLFGSALDADDHYPGAGYPLEAEGNAAIRQAFAQNPELAALLPRLHAEVIRGDDLADRGFEIMDELQAAAKSLSRL